MTVVPAICAMTVTSIYRRQADQRRKEREEADRQLTLQIGYASAENTAEHTPQIAEEGK